MSNFDALALGAIIGVLLFFFVVLPWFIRLLEEIEKEERRR